MSHTTVIPRSAKAPWSAIVLTSNGAALATRHHVQNVDYLPAGLLFDPVWLLNQCAAMLAATEGVVIVPQVPGPYGTAEWDALDYHAKMAALITAARGTGWQCTDNAADPDAPRAWVTFWRTGSPTVVLGVADHIEAAADQLVDPAEPPGVTAQLLARYQAATGVAWRGAPGNSGIQMIRADYDRKVLRKGRWVDREQPTWIERLPDIGLTGCGDIIWHRRAPKTGGPDDLRVYRFDIRGCYAAAAGLAELPQRTLINTGAIHFDRALSGYWRIVVPTSVWWARNNSGRPPIINPSRMNSARAVWVTTPIMDFMDELRIQPEIIDSYTCEDNGRILRAWYERLRDARTMVPTADQPRLARIIKGTANAAVGQMRTGRGRIQRRIFADTTADLARANLLRKLYGAQATHEVIPFRVHHDAAYFEATETEFPRLCAALGVAPEMGKFKHDGTWSIRQYLATRGRQAAAERRKVNA